MTSFLIGEVYLKTYVIFTPSGYTRKIYGNVYILYDYLRPSFSLQEYNASSYISIFLPGNINDLPFIWFWQHLNCAHISSDIQQSLWKRMNIGERLEIWSYFKWFSLPYTSGLYEWYYEHLLDGTVSIAGREEILQEIIDYMPEEVKMHKNGILSPFDTAYSRLASIPIHMTPGINGRLIPDIEHPSVHIVDSKYIFVKYWDKCNFEEIPIDIDVTMISGHSPRAWKKGDIFLVNGGEEWYLLSTEKTRNVTSSTLSYRGVTDDESLPIFTGIVHRKVVEDSRVSLINPVSFLEYGPYEMRVGSTSIFGDPEIMKLRSETVLAADKYVFMKGERINFHSLLYVWSYLQGLNVNHNGKAEFDTWKYINYFQVDLRSMFVETYLYKLLNEQEFHKDPRKGNELLYRRLIEIIGSVPKNIRHEYKLLTGMRIDKILAKIWIGNGNVPRRIFDSYIENSYYYIPEDPMEYDSCIIWYMEGNTSCPRLVNHVISGRRIYSNGMSRTSLYKTEDSEWTIHERAIGRKSGGKDVDNIPCVMSFLRKKEPPIGFKVGPGRLYDRIRKDVESVTFPISCDGKHKYTLYFSPPVSERSAVDEVGNYLLGDLTKDHFDVVSDELHDPGMTWTRARQIYRTRGELISSMISARGSTRDGGKISLTLL